MTIQEDRFVLFPTRKFSFVKLSVFAALFAAAALCCSVTQADIVMSLTKISSEQDVYTNVPNASSVKYAINYGGVAVNGPIDGVTFVNQGGSSYYTSFNGYNTPQQSFTSRNKSGLLNHASGSYSGSGITELNKLLSTMVYNNGQPQNGEVAVTFGNLETGKTYTARVLTRSWNTDTSERQHTFSIDLNADGVREEFTYGGNQVTSQVVSEDQPFSGEAYAGPYAVDYTFTAQSNTASIFLRFDGTTNHAWHNYGVMLIETNAKQVKPTTPTLYNGSFEADKWVLEGNADNGHGYLDRTGNTGVISGWQFTNLTNSTVSAGLAWVGGPCQDFLGNQTPPNGNQLAWLQGNNNMDVRLYQNVYGFNPEDKDTVYRVSMDLGTRGTNKPSFSLYIGEDQATEKAYISSIEVPSKKFTTYGAVFAPNADTQTIAIGNKTSGDNTLLIDNVQLQAYELTTFFIDNYKVTNNRNGASIGMATGDADDRFGGLLGGLSYTVKVSGNEQIQVGHNYAANDVNECNKKCTNALFFATRSDRDQSHASPDYNFANVGAMTTSDEGGRMYDISFQVAPQFDEGTSSSNWAAIIFGVSESKRTANVNGSDGVGILFRRNGGVEIWDKGSKITTNNVFTLDNDWANVRVVYFVPDFNGSSPVEVSLYINDKLISSFQTATGFIDNFIQFEGYSNSSDGYRRSLVKNLVVKSSAELQYDVSRIQDLSREWAPNGKDKLDVFFNAPRSDEATEAVHTGALTLEADTEINVDEGYTLKQTGDVTGNHTITKIGDGVLQIYGAAAGDVDIESLVVSSGRVDVKGFMAGSVLVGSDAVFSPGNSVGTVVIDGEFKAEEYATLLFEQDASGMDSLTASSFALNDDTQFVLDITAIVPGATYDIIISSDEDFTEADSVWLDKLSEIVPDYFDFSIVDNHIVRLYMNPNAVPEPSTWALLILGVSGLLYLRKRR